MTLDKEYEVAVQAVKLVIAILKFSDNVLSDKVTMLTFLYGQKKIT